MQLKLYDKWDDFNVLICVATFQQNLHMEYIYIYLSCDTISRPCSSYHDFLDRGLLPTRKLLNQGFLVAKLKSSLQKFCGRPHDLVNHYRISVSQITTSICSICPNHNLVSWLITRFLAQVNMTGATCETGTAYPSEAPEFTPSF